jgi:phage terminase Nu1 subunit (DNA packaging protein)
MKNQRPTNATDLITQQQYADLFNRHIDPMQRSLNRLNNNTIRLNNDFNTFWNENLAALGKQRANIKNMNTAMQ